MQVNDILKIHNNFYDTGNTKSIEFRVEQLKRLRTSILENETLIIEALYKDLHKSEFEAYATEIGFSLGSISSFIKKLKKWAKPKKVRTPIVHFCSKSYVYSEPYGTVLIIGPFNYPFQLIIEPLIGAIAAGNCAVLKPSEFTPNVSKVLVKVITQAFSPEYVRVVEGERELTSELINAPFDYIFFTGSVGVGKIVMEAAAKHLVPVTLELGGKSPCIVEKDANIEVAATRIAWGKFLNTGQTCVAPDYIMIHKDIKEKFIAKLIENIKKFYTQSAIDSPDYGRIVNERQLSRLISLLDKEKVVYGGDYDVEKLYMAPTIMDGIGWDDKVMQDEIFGPIFPILEYEDLDSAIKIINKRPKPLALYLFTENKASEKKVIENVSFGGGCINDTITHLANPNLPFGGVGTSGIGAYHYKSSYDLFSHKKSILKKSTLIRIPFVFPPYSKKKLDLIRKLMR